SLSLASLVLPVLLDPARRSVHPLDLPQQFGFLVLECLENTLCLVATQIGSLLAWSPLLFRILLRRLGILRLALSVLLRLLLALVVLWILLTLLLLLLVVLILLILVLLTSTVLLV